MLFGKKEKNKPALSVRRGEKEPKPEKKKAQEVVAPATKLPKGEDAYSYRIILEPHITEKGTLLGEQNKYAFRVASGAGKVEIKKAIQKLYKVGVKKVHILKMPSKFRQVGRFEGKRPGFKKAIVTLKEGDKIEIAA